MDISKFDWSKLSEISGGVKRGEINFIGITVKPCLPKTDFTLMRILKAREAGQPFNFVWINYEQTIDEDTLRRHAAHLNGCLPWNNDNSYNPSV